ncbi:MAG: LPS export ABC transporter ATP-binding protein, partial [Elusimicrobia bacterium]|nr:LPS export ABC transporter ATP-binding protein [Elusimicrobiota bacterium]
RETLSITDRSYLIHSGRILIEGGADILLNDPKARELYLGWDFKL